MARKRYIAAVSDRSEAFQRFFGRGFLAVLAWLAALDVQSNDFANYFAAETGEDVLIA